MYFFVTLPPKHDLSSSFTSKPALADANTRKARLCTAASVLCPKYSSLGLHLCKLQRVLLVAAGCRSHAAAVKRAGNCNCRRHDVAAIIGEKACECRVRSSALHLGRSVKNCTSVRVVSTKYCAIRLSVSSRLPICITREVQAGCGMRRGVA